MASLPSHRQLLTRLVDSLSRAPPPLTDAAATTSPSSPDASRDEPPDSRRRHLLLTLHVIFPGLLLPALDVLDRGLATRITTGPAPAAREDQTGPDASRAGAAGRSSIYVVRSLASTAAAARRKRASSSSSASTSRSYVVGLDAWNCSCAAFTLDAFPPAAAGRPLAVSTDAETAGGEGGDTPDWSFGGLSLDGGGGLAAAAQDVPCCKHLLACLLAERWGSVVGAHVEQRIVTKEELAGIVGVL